jgi:hypothetical protein
VIALAVTAVMAQVVIGQTQAAITSLTGQAPQANNNQEAKELFRKVDDVCAKNGEIGARDGELELRSYEDVTPTISTTSDNGSLELNGDLVGRSVPCELEIKNCVGGSGETMRGGPYEVQWIGNSDDEIEIICGDSQ